MDLLIPENQFFVRKSDYVLESIRTSILLGRIPAGSSITEKQIKDVLKVSSSPVREAFNQLEAEGLLVRLPHMGARVPEIALEDASEIYRFQALLQSSAVQLSAHKLPDTSIQDAQKLNSQIEDVVSSGKVEVDVVKVLNYRFHMIVCGASIYPWFTRVLSALWIRLPKKTVWVIPREAKAALTYHKKILAAIQKRDAVLAGRVMKEHLERSHKVLYP